jgi:hypothetical protein
VPLFAWLRPDLYPLSKLVLTGSLVLIGAGAFALTKLDEGFVEYMDEASCKVRGNLGLQQAGSSCNKVTLLSRRCRPSQAAVQRGGLRGGSSHCVVCSVMLNCCQIA